MKTFMIFITIMIMTFFVFAIVSFEVFVLFVAIIVLFGLTVLEEKATEILDKLNKIEKNKPLDNK